MADLITVARVKDALEKTDTKHDSLLQLIISSYTPVFENYLNCLFNKESRTKLFNGGRTKYYLNAIPLDSTVEPVVTVAGEAQVKNTDYWVDTESGLIEFGSVVSYSEPLEVSITYTGGYDLVDDSDDLDFGTLAVPYAIKAACVLQCMHTFRRRNDLGLSFVSMPNGQLAVNTSLGLLPLVEKMIRPYKLAPGQR